MVSTTKQFRGESTSDTILVRLASYLLPEIVSGGVALVDIDNDDDLDIYFVQEDHSTQIQQVKPELEIGFTSIWETGNFARQPALTERTTLGMEWVWQPETTTTMEMWTCM